MKNHRSLQREVILKMKSVCTLKTKSKFGALIIFMSVIGM